MVLFFLFLVLFLVLAVHLLQFFVSFNNFCLFGSGCFFQLCFCFVFCLLYLFVCFICLFDLFPFAYYLCFSFFFLQNKHHSTSYFFSPFSRTFFVKTYRDQTRSVVLKFTRFVKKLACKPCARTDTSFCRRTLRRATRRM